MCDTTLSTFIILGALALLPGTTSRYVFIALACTSFIFLAAHHQGPAQKFARLEDAIRALEEILECAKAASSYARNHMEVTDVGCRLLQYVQTCWRGRKPDDKIFRVKLSASKIRSNLLAMRSATWKTYFKNIRAILQIIDQCAKEVKEIQTAMLLITEGERQRKLTEGIIESQEVLGAIVLLLSVPYNHAFLACTYPLQYRFGSMYESKFGAKQESQTPA
ncbi:hypothetical protein B0H13DRAFT_1884799 [Mycena leptocephala]|nr:hypothetical protein B0H13DRAFT_1884799 [Mycena leptocephala]